MGFLLNIITFPHDLQDIEFSQILIQTCSFSHAVHLLPIKPASNHEATSRLWSFWKGSRLYCS